MKKVIFLSMLLGSMALGFTSCDDDDEDNNMDNYRVDEVVFVQKDYLGLMTVTYNDVNYETDSVNVLTDVDSSFVSLDLKKVKFVPQMPVSIDMTVPNIPCSRESDKVVFSADSIVPTSNGKEFVQYTAYGINGEIKGDSISFSLKFGNYPTSYKGVLKK